MASPVLICLFAARPLPAIGSLITLVLLMSILLTIRERDPSCSSRGIGNLWEANDVPSVIRTVTGCDLSTLLHIVACCMKKGLLAKDKRKRFESSNGTHHVIF